MKHPVYRKLEIPNQFPLQRVIVSGVSMPLFLSLMATASLRKTSKLIILKLIYLFKVAYYSSSN